MPFLRREFVRFATKAALSASAIGMGLYSLARALVPDILYEPSPESSIGKPESYPEGATFIPDKRLFVLREGNDFSIISAVCTHLGCTVTSVPLTKIKEVSVRGKILQERWEFSCPCHGSRYFADGTNYAGPAPKPLRRWSIVLSPVTGELIVNTARQVDHNFKVTL